MHENTNIDYTEKAKAAALEQNFPEAADMRYLSINWGQDLLAF